MGMEISELYFLCAELLKEFAPLKGKGLVTKKVGKFTIEVTADEEIKLKNGMPIKPFLFYIHHQDQPIAIVAPKGGQIIGAYGSEDKLIDYFKNFLKEK